jgi:hypothetical protein
MGPRSQSAQDRYLVVPTVVEKPTFSKSIMLPTCQKWVSSSNKLFTDKVDSGKASYIIQKLKTFLTQLRH